MSAANANSKHKHPCDLINKDDASWLNKIKLFKLILIVRVPKGM